MPVFPHSVKVSFSESGSLGTSSGSDVTSLSSQLPDTPNSMVSSPVETWWSPATSVHPSMLNPTPICMNTKHLTTSTWGTRLNHGKQHTATLWIKLGTHKSAKKTKQSTEPNHRDSPYAFTPGVKAGTHTDPRSSRGIWTSWPSDNNIPNNNNVFTSIHYVVLSTPGEMSLIQWDNRATSVLMRMISEDNV